MPDAVASLLKRCLSAEHGRRLLCARRADLTAETITALQAEAASLRAQADPAGAAEWEGWAGFARALITRRDVEAQAATLCQDPDTNFRPFLDRFDAPFFDLCLTIANSTLAEFDAILQSPGGITAQARDAAATAANELSFLVLVAHVADRPDWMAKAHLGQATRFRLLARLERRAGNLTAADRAEQEALIRLDQAPAATDPTLLARTHPSAALPLLQTKVENFEREVWRIGAPLRVRRLVEEILPDLEAIIDIRMQQGEYEQALECIDAAKARPLLRAMAQLATALKPVPQRLRDRRRALLDALETGTPGLTAEEIQDALGDTEAEIETLGLKAFALDLQCRPLPFTDMKAAIPPGAAILSYYVLRSRTLAFLLTADGLLGPPITIALTEHDLSRHNVQLTTVIRLRQDFTGWDAVQRELDTKIEAVWPEESLAALHAALIEPFKPRLQGLTQLWISPHGTLMHTPLHALAGADGIPLAETVPLAYTPSIAVLARCRRQRRDRRDTLFAAGTDAGGLARAESEVDAIAGLWNRRGQQATVAAVLADAPAADIVHLACHSDTRALNTAFQGLRLQDGTLNSLQIAATPFAASLVTLSACDTASGDLQPRTGSEMAGMMGAFFRAGCPSVIGSFWPVDDRVGAALMTAFYRRLRDPGTSKAAALAAAQHEVRAGLPDDFQHPYFWAPFSLWATRNQEEHAMSGYKGLSTDSLAGPARHMALPGTSPDQLRAMLPKLPAYPVYGLLLSPDPAATLTTMVTKRWDQLDHLSGANILLFALAPPDLSDEFKTSWQQRLGPNFEPIWRDWQNQKSKAYAAQDFATMFPDQSIKRADMPCLALFTDPDAQQAVVLKVPGWDEDDLLQWLKATFDAIDACAAESDPAKRLALLQSTLNTVSAKAKRDLGHLYDKAEAYVRANPAKTITTALSFVLALATANILPLGALGIGFVKDLLQIVKSA